MKTRANALPAAPGDGVHPPQVAQSRATGKQCKAITKDGTACTAWATPGGLCFLHANPDKASELGQRGGKINRRFICNNEPRTIAAPETAGDVKRMLAETMADTRAGKVDPKLGSTLGYLGMSLLRAFEVADLEQRLERLEQKNELENQAEQTGKNEASRKH